MIPAGDIPRIVDTPMRGHLTPPLIDQERQIPVPGAAAQFDAVWILFQTSLELQQDQRHILFNAARILTEMGGLEGMLLTANVPTAGLLTAESLRTELEDVRKALQSQEAQGAGMAALSAIEDCRRECHQLADSQCDAIIHQQMLREENGGALDEDEHILTLAALPERFKGKKPVALVLPSGVEVKTPTWKKAVATILQDCCADPRRHERMMELRGMVFGNCCPLLAKTPEEMGAPLKIDEGLYWESKFDTEALLRNLTDKLLCRVGYDYQGVVVRYRDPQQETAVEEQARGKQEFGSGFGPGLSL